MVGRRYQHSVHFAPGQFDPLRFFSLGLPQSTGLRTMPPNFGSSEVAAITPEMISRLWTTTERGDISVSVFKADT